MKPQCARLLALLRAAGDEGVTPAQARSAGVGDRCAARVADLKAEGYAVTTELVPVATSTGTARVARYRLVERVSPYRGWQPQMFDRPDFAQGAGLTGASPRVPQSSPLRAAEAPAGDAG